MGPYTDLCRGTVLRTHEIHVLVGAPLPIRTSTVRRVRLRGLQELEGLSSLKNKLYWEIHTFITERCGTISKTDTSMKLLCTLTYGGTEAGDKSIRNDLYGGNKSRETPRISPPNLSPRRYCCCSPSPPTESSSLESCD